MKIPVSRNSQAFHYLSLLLPSNAQEEKLRGNNLDKFKVKHDVCYTHETNKEVGLFKICFKLLNFWKLNAH